MFLDLISFLHSSEVKDVEDFRSFGIIGFESHFPIFDPVDREVNTESVEPCIGAQSSCLGFTISNVPQSTL